MAGEKDHTRKAATALKHQKRLARDGQDGKGRDGMVMLDQSLRPSDPDSVSARGYDPPTSRPLDPTPTSMRANELSQSTASRARKTSKPRASKETPPPASPRRKSSDLKASTGSRKSDHPAYRTRPGEQPKTTRKASDQSSTTRRSQMFPEMDKPVRSKRHSGSSSTRPPIIPSSVVKGGSPLELPFDDRKSASPVTSSVGLPSPISGASRLPPARELDEDVVSRSKSKSSTRASASKRVDKATTSRAERPSSSARDDRRSPRRPVDSLALDEDDEPNRLVLAQIDSGASLPASKKLKRKPPPAYIPSPARSVTRDSKLESPSKKRSSFEHNVQSAGSSRRPPADEPPVPQIPVGLVNGFGTNGKARAPEPDTTDDELATADEMESSDHHDEEEDEAAISSESEVDPERTQATGAKAQEGSLSPDSIAHTPSAAVIAAPSPMTDGAENARTAPAAAPAKKRGFLSRKQPSSDLPPPVKKTGGLFSFRRKSAKPVDAQPAAAAPTVAAPIAAAAVPVRADAGADDASVSSASVIDSAHGASDDEEAMSNSDSEEETGEADKPALAAESVSDPVTSQPEDKEMSAPPTAEQHTQAAPLGLIAGVGAAAGGLIGWLAGSTAQQKPDPAVIPTDKLEAAQQTAAMPEANTDVADEAAVVAVDRNLAAPGLSNAVILDRPTADRPDAVSGSASVAQPKPVVADTASSIASSAASTHSVTSSAASESVASGATPAATPVAAAVAAPAAVAVATEEETPKAKKRRSLLPFGRKPKEAQNTSEQPPNPEKPKGPNRLSLALNDALTKTLSSSMSFVDKLSGVEPENIAPKPTDSRRVKFSDPSEAARQQAMRKKTRITPMLASRVVVQDQDILKMRHDGPFWDPNSQLLDNAPPMYAPPGEPSVAPRRSAMKRPAESRQDAAIRAATAGLVFNLHQPAQHTQGQPVALKEGVNGNANGDVPSDVSESDYYEGGDDEVGSVATHERLHDDEPSDAYESEHDETMPAHSEARPNSIEFPRAQSNLPPAIAAI
ncbi:uncharacterized protein L969DRAFT_92809 [Mixia osmundae IAM 14324]|uniref:Uncharacterized protein n=1 Tax=Mixia osmundae (strain CBS 9802 / IAM 14324 / JCM 22182 / KY 12970) TaxID=764103 RepID=G7DYM3_MIXOS|nr:uncharacterized protein L969DRAFT_92809 [Mixia osmundae IAM 14324]KEI41582.1 hypothetical protein L969DRAFT_92809 [Mixia osmundae IAM 14324]GAA95683.1 hypothetical protein E5Q_02340 [Mixia osmundae IAM 14324]